jgi:PAS domain S-box-containing protein
MSFPSKNQNFPGSGDVLLNNHPLPTWLVDSGDLQIYYSNKPAAGFYAYSAEEFFDKSFLDLFTEESRIRFFQKLAQTTDPARLNGCYRHRKKDGEIFCIQLFASGIKIDNKNFYQLTAVPDPEQKNLEEESIRYKSYIENCSAGIYCHEFKKPVPVTISPEDFIARLKVDGAISECNKAMADMYGFAHPSNAVGLLPSQLMDLTDPVNVSFIRSFIASGFKAFTAESHEKDKNGHSKYFLNNAIGVIENGYLKRIWGTQIDITERKQAEKNLAESEKRFKEVADSAPVMIWMSDENDRLIYLNKKWLEFTGEDISGTEAPDWFSFVHPDDYAKAKERYDTAFRQKHQATLIYRLRRKDGAYRWVHDVSIPRLLSDGSFVGYIGSVVEIEEQKQKEEQLRYQATIFENVSDIIVTSDLNCVVKSWNKAAEDFYGINAKDCIGKPLTEIIQPDYQAMTRQEVLARLFETGIWKGEVAFRNKEGQLKYVLNTLSVVVNEKGERTGVLTVGRDITERKIAEQKLQQSEGFYRTLIADSLDGIILMNAQGKINFCSPSVKNVLGFEVQEVEGRNGFEFVHPEDLAWALQSFEREVLENPEVKFITVRLRKKTGEWVWCLVRGHNLLNNPYVGNIVVYFHDDSFRKQASEALKESEKRFRSLIRDLQVGVFLSDKDGEIIMCNKALSLMLSIPEEMIVGKKVYDILSDDMVNERAEPIPRHERPLTLTIQSAQAVKGAVVGVLHPITNERKWVMVNADPILEDDGSIKHVVCSMMDITERKRLEQKLISDQISHQKELTQATIDGQEAERREIGKELHDNIGQQLTTIKLFLDMVKATAGDSSMEMVNMAMKGVADVINEIRSMSRSLLPHTLKDLGLVDSVSELIDSVGRAQLMKINFVCDEFEEELLPENQKLTLFRITQEQLNNITRHAGAKNILISLRNSHQSVALEIRDDGKGFDKKKLRRGLGFTNIRNRAELFGGTAEVFSKPGEGCALKVYMPVKLSGAPLLDAHN